MHTSPAVAAKPPSGAPATSADAACGRGQHLVTTKQLADLIRPFVGAKINRQRDTKSPYGGYLPRTAAIDIHHRTERRDADIRSAGPDGVEDFFYADCDLIPWHSIRGITIAALDSMGNRTAETTYRHLGVVRSVA